jgi:hypothetical protein
MDPVHHLLYLLEQDVSYAVAREHTKQRFGISDDDLNRRLRAARKDATAVLRALDALPRDA